MAGNRRPGFGIQQDTARGFRAEIQTDHISRHRLPLPMLPPALDVPHLAEPPVIAQ